MSLISIELAGISVELIGWQLDAKGLWISICGHHRSESQRNMNKEVTRRTDMESLSTGT